VSSLFYLGELGAANEHLKKALAVFDHGQPLSVGSESSRVTSFFRLQYGLFEIGYLDRARAISREMLEVAQRSCVPLILAQASCYLAFNNLVRGDSRAAHKCAEEAMALAEEMGHMTLSAIAISCHGAALIAQGRYEKGIAETRRGFSVFRSPGGCPSQCFGAIWPAGSKEPDSPRKDFRCSRRDSLPSRRPGSRSPVVATSRQR
jgi:tetratricopeptide (TPR) repeat protein